MIVCEEMKKLRKMLDEKNISWHDASEIMSESKEWPMWICRTHFKYNGLKFSVVNGFGTYGDYNRMWPAYGVGYQYDGKWCGDVRGHKLKVIAWQPFPDYEGEMEIEEELPFK